MTTADRGLTAPLARVLGIEASEVGRASALFALSFVLGLALVTFDLALQTSLVLSLETTELPWAQVVVGVTVPCAGLALAWLQPRVSLTMFVAGPLAAVALVGFVLIGALVGQPITAGKLLALWATEHVLTAIAIVGFWAVAARTFNVAQSRRVYGIIGAGELVAAVVGGLLASTLRSALSLPALLATAMGGVVAGVLLSVPLSRDTETSIDEEPDAEAPPARVKAHGWRCVAYFAAGIFTSSLVQFIVLVSVQRAYPGRPEVIAGALGTLLSARLALGALLQIFVTGRVLGRLGIRPGLYSTPSVVGVMALGAFALSPLLVSSLAAAIALQAAEATVRAGFGQPAFLAAQRPMPARARDRTLLILETAVEPAATGLAGLGLLLAPPSIFLGPSLLLLPFPTALAWLFFASSLDRSYRKLVVNDGGDS